MTDASAMVRVRSLSGEVLATATADVLRDVRDVKRHLRSLYSYPACLQQILQDERVLEERALVDESADLQLVLLSELVGLEQVYEGAREFLEYVAETGHVEVPRERNEPQNWDHLPYTTVILILGNMNPKP